MNRIKRSSMTRGMRSAISKSVDGSNPSEVSCPHCHYVYPKYPGKYPDVCPVCGKSITTKSKKLLNFISQVKEI